MIALWTGATYLYRHNPHSLSFLIPGIPAVFMSAVTSTYILQAKEGLELSTSITYPLGIIFAILCAILFARHTFLKKKAGY